MSSRLAVRLAVLGLAAVLLEIVGVSQISVFGVSADLTPLVVMSAGLLCGSVQGAAIGFGMGLFLDLVLVQTLGLSSLILALVGYAAGRLRELRDPQGPLLPIAMGAAVTVASEAGYSLAQFLLGVDGPVSLLLARDIVTTVIVNALLAPGVLGLSRRWLTPTLSGGDPRRRRRAYAPAGTSPLSRA